MHSLKQQLMVLIIGPLVVLALVGAIMTGMLMKDRAVLATNTKATSDLSTGEEIIELMYPGPWQEVDGVLYKGAAKISNNFIPVDRIALLTGDTVTIFLGDTRVSTTVREESGERAIGTKSSEAVSNRVLKDGQMYLGQANVVGEQYQTAYKPIRDQKGKIIGMFYVGISKKFSQQLIYNSMVTIGIFSVVLTAIVALIAWYFTQRAIIGPLKQMTISTKQVATGKPIKKLDIDPSNSEIGELANALNQMIDGMQGFAVHIAKVAGNTGAESGDSTIEAAAANKSKLLPSSSTGVLTEVSAEVSATVDENSTQDFSEAREKNSEMKDNFADSKEELPKGLNETTMRQILIFLSKNNTPMSAEEIGEGVSLTRVTARRYLEYLEKAGRVEMELKYGTVGRPVKLYKSKE